MRQGDRHRKSLTRVFGLLVAVMTGGTPASATVIEAGGFSFSDEMGGFRILSASGSGSLDDPIVVIEELEEAFPVTLVIRRLTPFASRAGENAISFNLVKQVANRSGRVWAGFELELQEELRKPSVYGDGLSFNQFGAGEPDVQSDAFAVNERLFEPHDRIRFQNGHVDPDQQAQFRVSITDPTPTTIFYLVQDPQLLSAAIPRPGRAAAATRSRPLHLDSSARLTPFSSAMWSESMGRCSPPLPMASAVER